MKVTGPAASVKELSRARDWRLVPAPSGAPVTAAVTLPAAPDTLELDLSKAKVPPGDYHLQATWDWSPLDLGGVLHVHPYGDFAHLEIATRIARQAGRGQWHRARDPDRRGF